MNQRWRDRKASYRRDPSERINPLEFEVAEIKGAGADTIARTFVERHHYSASYPAARWRFGLYRRGELAGVAVFSVPCHESVICKPLGVADANDGVDLGRFVLLNDVKWNGETWFLARCFEVLRREGLAGAVAMSDPMPRTTADGTIVFPGHFGTIYQAFNAVYLGQTDRRSLKLLNDGSVFSARAASKIRNGESGSDYAIRELVRAGARDVDWEETPREWLAKVLPHVTRTVRHPGNHRYAWAFTKAVARHLVAGRHRYPKRAREIA